MAVPAGQFSDCGAIHSIRAACGRTTDGPSGPIFFRDDADRAFLRPLRQAEIQWGCAVQLGTVRFLETFVDDPENIPTNIGDYLAAQLGLSGLPAYVQTRVHWDHQRRIITQYHYALFDAHLQHWRLTRWLYTRAWTAAERLDLLHAVDPGRWDLHLLPTARIQALARFVATARAQTVERLTPERRVATLVAFATVFHQTAQDDFFELFDRFLSEHWSRATRQQAQSHLRTIRELDAAAKICRDACTILLQEDTPGARIRDAIWPPLPMPRRARPVRRTARRCRRYIPCYDPSWPGGGSN